MHGGLAPDGSTVDAALSEWRRKAAEALLAASIISYMPGIVLVILGKAPPSTGLVQVTIVGAYMVVVVCTIYRRIDFRIRAGVMLWVAYFMIFIGNLAVPQGPYLRALPVFLPVLVLILFGVRAERYATACSAAILFCVPLLHNAPFLTGLGAAPGREAQMPLAVMMTQSAGLMGALAVLMILLERFYQFLLDSLTKLEMEAANRRAAYQNLEWEMSEKKRLEREAARAGDEERRRLGHEIHDGVCQQLTGALLRSEALARRLSRKETIREEDISALSSVIEEAIDEARAAAKGICPLGSEPNALESGLQVLAKRTWNTTNIPCLFETEGDVAVPDFMMAQHLYRIAQEAINNAVRHACASRIDVALRRGRDGLLLEVVDNGQGFPDYVKADGLGLRTMEYRAHLLEGEFAVTPNLPGGTRVACRVPYNDNNPPGACPRDSEKLNHGN